MSLLESLHREHVERRRRLFSPAVKPVEKPKPRSLVLSPEARRAIHGLPEVPEPPPPLDWPKIITAPTREKIIAVVIEGTGLSKIDLLSRRRTTKVVLPRQVAMYLAKETTLWSLPEIGRRFEGRDHTTVLHAWRKIARRVATDEQFAAFVAGLRAKLEAAE